MLNRIREWLSSNSTTRGRKPSASGYRPTVECLDQRVLLTLNAHNHLVIPHVEIHAVYYGQDWTSTTGQANRGQLNGYLQDIAGSSYMSALGEYGVGTGTTGKDDVVAGSSPTKAASGGNPLVSEANIQGMLTSEILTSRLPESTGRQLYVVYLPPGVTDANDAAGKDYAHHGTFLMSMPHSLLSAPYVYWTADRVYYAVINNPIGNFTIKGLNQFQQQTEVTSHELAEAVTDPDLRNGWFDENLQEIGDLANLQYSTFSVYSARDHQTHTYTMQKEWSAYSGAAMMPKVDSTSLNGTTYYFTYRWSFTWSDGWGVTRTVYHAIGLDGKIYSSFSLGANDTSGWATYT